MTNTTDYQKQAQDFLNATGVAMEVKFKEYGKHFPDDKEDRDIYTITLKRGQRSFTFDFGQSIRSSGEWNLYGNSSKGVAHRYGDSFDGIPKISYVHPSYNGNEGKKGAKLALYHPNWLLNPSFASPTDYNVLTCLTKHEVGTFEDFCSNFGYDTDSRKAENIYKAVLNEYQNVCMLWNEKEIEQLQEIQ